MATSGMCLRCGEFLEPGDRGPVCAGCLFDAADGSDGGSLRAAVLTPGSRIGSFEIIRWLGTGGMAVVYEAYEESLQRVVALKVLPPHFLHDDTFAARFTREARIAASLEHPNIVPIYSSGIHEGLPWMSMRLQTGGSLAGVLERGALDFDRAVRILRDVAGALDYAHARGVIHRDVKPSNMLLDGAGRAYLGDFGLAYLVEARERLSKSGTVAGTPSYMAPEQGLGLPLDHRCDVYSLGVVAYEMLTGGVPFEQSSPVAVLMQHARAPVPVPSPQVVPAARFDVLRQSLAKSPEARWSSAAEFVTALESASGLKGSAVFTRLPGRRLAAGMAAVVAVGLGALMVPDSFVPSPSPEPLSRGWDERLPKEEVPKGPEAQVASRSNVESDPPGTPLLRTSSQYLNAREPSPILPTGLGVEFLLRGTPDAEERNQSVSTPGPPDSPVERPVAPSVPPVLVEPVCTVEFRSTGLIAKARLTGRVTLRADIDAEGRASNLRVIKSSDTRLDREAEDALKKTRCTPGQRDGRPDSFRAVEVHVDFVIRR